MESPIINENTVGGTHTLSAGKNGTRFVATSRFMSIATKSCGYNGTLMHFCADFTFSIWKLHLIFLIPSMCGCSVIPM